MRHLGLVLLLLLALSGLLLAGRLLATLVAGLVHLVEQVQTGHLELIGLLLDLLGGGSAFARLVLGNEFAEGRELLLNAVGLSLVKLVGILVQSTLRIVEDTVGTVGSLDSSLTALISLSVLLGILNHLLNLVLRKTGARGDGNGLVLVRRLVLGVDVDDRVGVDVEGDLNLGNSAVGRGDTDELEVAKHLVILDKLTLTLVHLDLDGGLEVRSGGEDLRLLGGDSGVAVDQAGEDTTKGLDTEGQRSDVKEQEILDLSGENSTLDSGTHGDSLIGVDRLGGVAAEDALDGLGNLRHASHTTNKDNLLDLLGRQTGILESLAHGLNGALDKGVDHLLKLSTRELHVDVLRTGRVGSDEGQVDVGLERRGQLDLGLLSSLADALNGHTVTGEVNTRGLLEVGNHVADEVNIEILTTQVGVTVGGLNLKNTVLDLQNRDIESTTAKIVDSDNAVGLLLETVGESSGSGLINNTEDVEAGDLTSILGALTLSIVEVGRNSDDGVLDRLRQVGLGGLLHLVENEATNLRGRVLLVAGRDPGVAVAVLDDLVGHLLDVTLNLSIAELASY